MRGVVLALCMTALYACTQPQPQVIYVKTPLPSKNETIFLSKPKPLKMHPIVVYDFNSSKLYFCYMDFEVSKFEYNIQMLNQVLREYYLAIQHLIEVLKQYNYSVRVEFVNTTYQYK